MNKQEVLHELPLAEQAMQELICQMARGEVPLPKLKEGATARRSVVGEPNAYTVLHGRPQRSVVRICAEVIVVEDDDDEVEFSHQMYTEITA